MEWVLRGLSQLTSPALRDIVLWDYFGLSSYFDRFTASGIRDFFSENSPRSIMKRSSALLSIQIDSRRGVDEVLALEAALRDLFRHLDHEGRLGFVYYHETEPGIVYVTSEGTLYTGLGKAF